LPPLGAQSTLNVIMDLGDHLLRLSQKAARRMHRRLARADSESGAAAVEFALVVILLVGLVFGIIDFGVLFNQQISLSSAARSGARAGVVNGDGSLTCADITTQVQNQMANALNVDTTKVTVAITRLKPDGTASSTDPCSQPSGTGVCNNSTDSTTGQRESLQVVAGYSSKVLVPLLAVPVPGLGFTNPTFNLHSTAVFRCEYG
jgi:Flp pilus assembly protein TadG